MKISFAMTGFDEEVRLIIQPKDKWINHKHNNDHSITKVWKGENEIEYLIPVDNDVLVNFAPISSKDGETTDEGLIYVSASYQKMTKADIERYVDQYFEKDVNYHTRIAWENNSPELAYRDQYYVSKLKKLYPEMFPKEIEEKNDTSSTNNTSQKNETNKEDGEHVLTEDEWLETIAFTVGTF